jgi:phage recombination protein Bet
MTNNATPTIQAKGTVTYQAGGQDVRLSYDIVKNYLTKGNGAVTDQDLVQFISICKYNQLNPFLNEAYLVKFGTAPAQMIVSKEALMKRAESHKEYEGYQAGVIVQRGDEFLELEGSFYLNTDKLVGGWAKIYRSDRKFPAVSKVRLEEYDKKQSSWKEMASTMIAKVAKVQALREAFPASLGAMYTEEETRIINVEEVRANKEEVKPQPEPEETIEQPEKVQI